MENGKDGKMIIEWDGKRGGVEVQGKVWQGRGDSRSGEKIRISGKLNIS